MIWMIMCHSLFVRFSFSLLSNFLFLLSSPLVHLLSSYYQLARRTPSISPPSASRRHTSREILSSRTTPRARPVSWQMFLYHFRFSSAPVFPVNVRTIFSATLNSPPSTYFALCLFSFVIFTLGVVGFEPTRFRICF